MNRLRAKYGVPTRPGWASAFVWLHGAAASAGAAVHHWRRVQHVQYHVLFPRVQIELAAMRAGRSGEGPRPLLQPASLDVRRVATAAPAQAPGRTHEHPPTGPHRDAPSMDIVQRRHFQRFETTTEQRSIGRLAVEHRTSIERSVLPLAERIVTRTRRVERLPQAGTPDSPSPAMPAMAVRASAPRPEAVERPPVDVLPPASARPAAPPALNVEALTERVLRQIDGRLIAQRERLGRV